MVKIKYIRMKSLLKIIKILVLACITIFVSAWLYSRTLQPIYNGELSLNNLSENVVVHFDDNGVPHINAQSQKDAYTALGYVHAQDRLWQMELIRRIAPGRLSELFDDTRNSGVSEDLLPLPLDDVRKQLGIPAPAAFHPDGIAILKGSKGNPGSGEIVWAFPSRPAVATTA